MVLPGAMKFISSQTASGAASVSFTSGIDSTYDVYIFKWYDIIQLLIIQMFRFNGSTDGGSQLCGY